MARLLCTVLLLVIAAVMVDAEYCWNFGDYEGSTTRYCAHGCCGMDLDECCTADDPELSYYINLTGAATAGIVIAALIGLALIIGGVILVICCVSSNCFKTQGNQGVVFSNSACANVPPVTSVIDIGVAQPTVTKTQTAYQYPQQSTHVYNAGYSYP